MGQSPFDLSTKEVRRLINATCMKIHGHKHDVNYVYEETAHYNNTPILIRVYSPISQIDELSIPSTIFIHGGANVACSIETHDNLARYISMKTSSRVFSIEYSLAPEKKFPSQINECNAAIATILSKYKMKSSHVALSGDCNGANFAFCCALEIAKTNLIPLAHLLMINPTPDHRCEGTLERQNNKYDFIRWQTKQYIKNFVETSHPSVSPILEKNLHLLPATTIIAAEKEVSFNDTQHFYKLLKDSGINVNLYNQFNQEHLAGKGARVAESALESLDVGCAALAGSFR